MDYFNGARSISKEASEDQIERKISWVFDFYKDIQKAMPHDRAGNPRPSLVASPTSVVGTAPIHSKIVRHEGRDILAWMGSLPRKKYIPDPTVPAKESVQRVLTAIRSPKPDDLAELETKKIRKRERDWLMASTMAGAGFRAVEVSRLKMSDLTNGLRRDGILDGIATKFGSFSCLSDFSRNTKAQEAILHNIKSFVQKQQRKYLFVRIIGKGEKPRDAPFTPELVGDLLTVGVWGYRHQMIEEFKLRDPSYIAPDNLFISGKSKQAYKAGSISDILQNAFVDADVEGSGHDLRKFYATHMASVILEEHIGRMNGQMSEAVINTVFNRVADALGHSTVTTTVKHYVDMALIHWTGVRNKNRRSKVVKVWETLVENQDQLSEAKITLAGTLIKGLASVPDQSDLVRLLDSATRDPALNPASPMVITTPRNHLTSVPKD
ncbi:site-specific integrase [Rhizobium leguminosarum]|nr:site-specific integrase [Rhizobium leguminosarum]